MADMVKPDTRRKLAKSPDARGNEFRLWRGSTRCHHRQHRGVPFDVAKVVSFLASTTVASSPEAKSS